MTTTLRLQASPAAPRRRTARIAAAALGLALALGLPQAAHAACLTPGEARAAVTAGEALPLGRIVAAVPGEIVRADLCREDGRLVYVLSVLSGGRVADKVIDARSGRVLN